MKNWFPLTSSSVNIFITICMNIGTFHIKLQRTICFGQEKSALGKWRTCFISDNMEFSWIMHLKCELFSEKTTKIVSAAIVRSIAAMLHSIIGFHLVLLRNDWTMSGRECTLHRCGHVRIKMHLRSHELDPWSVWICSVSCAGIGQQPYHIGVLSGY